ncbi:MAG: DUF3842 family protein [Parasporobacterium sp.]|nr:DUF3842 family protein [Parasporobacterium sp.]
MTILVVDGQGGNLGSQIIKNVKERFSAADVIAVGTNAIASSSMLKAGAAYAATGENPLIVACRKADVIIGPIGIVIADAINGEVTPKMAVAAGQADATRILIPINKCENQVAGVPDLSMGALIEDAMKKLEQVMGGCC